MPLPTERYPLLFMCFGQDSSVPIDEYLRSEWPRRAWAISDELPKDHVGVLLEGEQGVEDGQSVGTLRAAIYDGNAGAALASEGRLVSDTLVRVITSGPIPDRELPLVSIPAWPPSRTALHEALSDLRPPTEYSLYYIRARVEQLLKQVHTLIDEKELLLLEIEEGRHTIDQLKAEIESLKIELRREKLDDGRTLLNVKLVTALLQLLAAGLAMGTAVVVIDDGGDIINNYISPAIGTCAEIESEIAEVKELQ